jgi:hypothetical protein
MARKQTKSGTTTEGLSAVSPILIKDIRQIIGEARRSVATAVNAVNAGLTLLYWRIGKRIVNEILGKERAAYGQQIVVSLARQIGSGIRPQLWREEFAPHDAVCRSLSQGGNCRIADATIELDPFHRSATPQEPAATGLLCGALRVEGWSVQQAAAKN